LEGIFFGLSKLQEYGRISPRGEANAEPEQASNGNAGTALLHHYFISRKLVVKALNVMKQGI